MEAEPNHYSTGGIADASDLLTLQFTTGTTQVSPSFQRGLDALPGDWVVDDADTGMRLATVMTTTGNILYMLKRQIQLGAARAAT
eukprot:4900137-Amphidinium_carterae.2